VGEGFNHVASWRKEEKESVKVGTKRKITFDYKPVPGL